CCMTGSLLARPHLLALPLLAIWTAELARERAEDRRPSWLLLPLLAVWVNIHASFLLGLALAGGLALEALAGGRQARWRVLREWGAFGIAALAACLLNPHFAQGVIFPLALMGTASLAHIGEWQPTDFSRLQPFELAVAAALYVILSRGVKISAVRTLILLGLLHLALSHQRHQIVVAVIAPLLLAEPLAHAFGAVEARLRNRLSGAVAALALIAIASLALLRFAAPVPRGDGAASPVTALSEVPA
ncbi:MAG TPA: hypothetical protein VGC36_03675, partial [Rhizomicrobium sp.]